MPPEREAVRWVLDSLPDSVNVYDREWRWLFMNPAARERYRTFGRDPEALMGRCVWDEFPAARDTAFHVACMRALATGEPVEVAERSPNDGRWHENRIVPTASGVVTYTRDVTERVLAAARADLLAATSQALVSSLDPVGMLDRVAGLMAGALSAWCIVDLVSQQTSHPEAVAVAHPDAARSREVRALRDAYPPDPDAKAGAPAVIRSGRAELHSGITDAALVGAASDERHLALLRRLGVHSAIVVPLIAHGRTFGALTLVGPQPGQRFTAADLALVEEVGRRAALAVDNARLYEAERDAREEAEAAAARTSRLQDVTAALTATLTPMEVARVVVAHGVGALRARSGVVVTTDEAADALVVLHAMGTPTTMAARNGRVALGADFPLSETVRLREPIVLSTAGAVAERYPQLAAGHAASDLGGLATFPLDVDGRSVGALAFGFPDGAVLGAEDRGFALTLAAQAAQALERARLYEAERRAARSARLLQVLTATFSAVLTPADVIRVFLERGLDALGAKTGVAMLVSEDGQRLELAGGRGYPAGFLVRYPTLPLASPFTLGDVVRDRTPRWLRTRAEALRDYPTLEEIYDAVGLEASATLPLMTGDGAAFGVLAIHFATPQRFDVEERALLEALAGQCAQALERARLFEAERQARQAAEAASRAKSDFLSTMSHELRTPLTAIAGYAELMDMGLRGPVTPAQREDLARIKRSGHHLLTLITDILSFARVEAGHVELHEEDVELEGVIADLGALVGPQMHARELVYSHTRSHGALTVRADPERVRQILLNLLTNAVKFTPRGGRVTLECAANAASVRIMVSDTGRGIPAGELERIFEPFVQVDRHLTHGSQQGVGLGLSIARDLARRMRGDLTVRSTVGSGCVFTLTLPRPAAARAEA